jgi:hypothetical protein
LVPARELLSWLRFILALPDGAAGWPLWYNPYMVYAWAVILVVVNLLWVLTNLLTLPGNWLVVATTLAIGWFVDGMFSIYTLIVLVGLALLGELLELVAGAAGARKIGGSTLAGFAAILGALAGGLVGAFVIPVPLFGSLIGACAGAFVFSTLAELSLGRSTSDSLRSGRGAAVGRLVASLLKFAVGLLMWVVASIAAFWP